MSATNSENEKEPARRDFLYVATSGMLAVGVAGAVWPLVHQMNPDAGTQALASIDVDVSAIEEGQSISVMWRGKPVFIRNRTADEVEEAKSVDLAALPDPQSDEERAAPGRENLLIQVGVCTHFGCIPLGQEGDYNGWFCPCHGSHYDTSGRIRKGPAPANMTIPPYDFISDDVVRIG